MNYTQAPYDRFADQPRCFGRRRASEWPQFRAEFIKAHPVCLMCGGTEMLEAHHLLPFHLFPSRELVMENLATLCERPGRCCHFIWGHLYDWSTYNPKLEICAKWWTVRRKRRKP